MALLRSALLSLLPALLCGAAPAGCVVERQAQLAVTLDGFMPTVEARINGQSVRLGVDTGAQGTILTPAAVQRLSLPRDFHRFATAIGVAGRILVNNAIVGELEFAGQVWTGRSVPVIAIAQPHGQTEPEEPAMDGIVGAEVLSQFDLDMDLPNRTLTLYRVEGCDKVTPRWDEAAATPIPAAIGRSGRPVIAVELDGRPARAIFDSGASATLLSPAPDGSRSEPATLFVVDQNASLSPRRVVTLRVGDETLPPAQLGHVDFPLGDADLLIGEDYMRTHRFWLSYATATLFIAKGQVRSAR
jgi:hypothetical protein